MRAVLLRRVLVLAVCALGVGALYLVPGLGVAPGRIGVPTPASEVLTGSDPAPEPVAASVAARSAAEPAARPAVRQVVPRSTPFDADPTEDTTPPAAVTALTVVTADAEQVRVAWAPGTDDVGVIGYKVWVNGYEVRSTSDTEITLEWFNDDNRHHVVVVRALDAAGNQSRTGATLVLTRPEPTGSTGIH